MELTEEIRRRIGEGIENCQVDIAGEGCNLSLTLVSPAFAGRSRLDQQRMVYRLLGSLITDGTLHALSIKSYTPEQWAQRDDARPSHTDD